MSENGTNKTEWQDKQGVTVEENSPEILSSENNYTIEVPKPVGTIIWLSLLVGILIGVLVGITRGFMLGVFFCVAIVVATMFGAYIMLRLHQDSEKNKKLAIALSCFVIFILLFIGIIMMIFSRAGFR